MAYTIQQFQALNSPQHFVVTQHSRKRLAERGISIDDVCNAIASGDIIEDYPNDYPVPSCLILGHSGTKAIHLCVSIMDNFVYLITAYIPDPEKWGSDFRTRKEHAK